MNTAGIKNVCYVLLLFVSASLGQAQNLSWAKRFGGIGTEQGNAVAVDASGNVYSAGSFSGTADFDPGAATLNLTSAGITDIYITKLNASGNLVWAKRIGGTNEDVAYSIAVDASGNVYTTGYFQGTVDFDPGAGTTNLISGTAVNNAFVSKLDATGNFVWAKVFVSTASEVKSNGIAVDASGNVYTTGSFSGLTTFPAGGTSLTLTGGTDAFVCKLSSAGVISWVKKMAGTLNESGNALALDASGNVCITGTFTGVPDFDPGAGTATLGSAGSDDVFICKLDASGNYVMAVKMGGTGSDVAKAIDTDAAGNIYTTGFFSGTADFDPGASTYNLTATASDVFTSKLDASGNFVWAVKQGGASNDRGYGISVDASSNVYTTGFFLGTVDFDPGAAVSNLVSVGTADAFVSKLNSSGSFVWAIAFSGTSDDVGYAITTDASTNVFVHGTFMSTSDFDPLAGTSNLTSAGSSDAFVVKLCAGPATPGSITGATTLCAGTASTYSVATVPGATSYSWILPSGWSGTSTTNTISATAGTASGNISVNANNTCGAGTASTLSVTINQVPAQPGAISGITTVCAGSAQTYNITAVPGATSYTWLLPSGWSGSSATTSIAATIGTTGGNVQVTAVNSCGNSTVRTVSVTVNQVPATPGTITGATNVCSGTSNTYSINPVAGATSYIWTLPSGWSGTSSSNSINTSAGSVGGNVQVVAINSCGSSSAQTLAVVANPTVAAPGAISGNTSVCVGSVNTYSITAVAGASSYSWTLPSGWSGTSSTNSISATTGSSGGNISVTANGPCSSGSSQTLAVSVNTVPGQPTAVIAPTQVCTGTVANYQVSSVPNSFSCTWVLPSGWSGTSTFEVMNTTVGNSSGNISITANNTCGSGPALIIPVVAHQTITSAPGSVTGNTSVCPGSSNTYSSGMVAGATSYQWGLLAGWTGTSVTNTIVCTAGSGSGNITVAGVNACGMGPQSTLNITTNNYAIAGVMSGNANVCEGSSAAYSVSFLPGVVYTWTLPSGWIGTSTTNTISATVGASGGTVVVTASNSCGTSGRNMTVAVNNLPAIPSAIAGIVSPCTGTNQTYSTTVVPGATSYTWNLPSGWTGSSTTNSIATIVGSLNGTVSVHANNGCGSGNSTLLAVTASDIPAQPSAISGNSSVCNGTTQNYFVTSVAGVSYAWSATSGTVTGSGNSIDITWNATGTQTITVVPSNSCGTGIAITKTVTVNSGTSLIQPGTISGNMNICEGVAEAYSISAVAGATSYTWVLPVGWSGSSTGTSITITPNGNSGNISVAANNSCGSSTSQQVGVNVNSIPLAPDAITGSVFPCAGSVETYSITTVSGAVSYNWILPSGWSGSSSSESITTTVGSVPGNISVAAVNSCGTSAAAVLAVSANEIPAAPSAINGNATTCEGTEEVYLVPAVAGATSYTWILPSGWTGSSTASSIVTNVGNTGGTLSVVAENVCGSSTSAVFNVSVSHPDINVIQSANDLTASSGMDSYQWLDCSNAYQVISGETNQNYSAQNNGSYAVLVSLNGCTDTSQCYTVAGIGLLSENNEEDLKVYPNPFSDVIHIQPSTHIEKVIITDALGRVLYLHTNKAAAKQIVDVPLETLKAGTYFVHVVSKNTTTIVKVVKPE